MISSQQKVFFKKTFIVIISGFLIPIVFFTYQTFSTTGLEAVANMTKEEKAIIEKVAQIESSMTPEEVYQILGTPTEDLIFVAKWNQMGGSPLSQGRVYFFDGHPRKFRLLKLGFFIYEVPF